MHNQARCPPSVLVVGTSMVWRVAVRGDWTFCYPGACVKDITLTALQLIEHNSASPVIDFVGVNDIKNQ